MPYLGNDLQVAQPSYRNIDDISGSFNSSTTSFPLLVSGSAPVPFPINSNQCLISVAGVVQRPDDSGTEGFRISSGNIIFSSAPSTGADFFGVILAGADYVNVGANFPSGSAAVPSITFDSDLDTGIYNSAANQVSITTAGTERLRIDSAGQIESVSLGSASAPAFSFTTDPNTGIYSPGADQVAISTGGSGRLFVDASGNVGAGTSSPAFAAGGGIQAKYATFSSFRATVGANTGTDFSAASDGKGYIYVRDNADLLIGTNNTERLRITSAGLVGIGTSSPANPLHIRNDAGSAQLKLDYLGSSSTIFGSSDLFLQPNGTTAMTLKSGGNVGIGTTSPAYPIHVTGSGMSAAFISNSSTAGVLLGSGSNLARISSNGSTCSLAFEIDATEKARLDSSGRLLVGTSSTSSTALLQVQGNSSSSTGDAIIQLRRGENNVSIINGESLGSIQFSNSESTVSAVIEAVADANWNTTNDYPSRLVFSVTSDGSASPTERVRIMQNGQFNTLDSGGNGIVSRSTIAANSSDGLIVGCSSATNTTNGSVQFVVRTNGNVVNTNNSYGAISDIKLKENIVDADSQWSDIKALQVRKYNFKEGQTHTQIGLVAQEVELVSPGLVSEAPDRDEDGNDLGTVTKSVNYSVLYMKAVKALQEAMERIEQLEAKVAALEAS